MMPLVAWIVLASVLLLGVVAAVLLVRFRKKNPRVPKPVDLDRARKTFCQQREWLEAKFMDLASNSGRPRGLRWTSCDFADEISFARERHSGEVAAFVGVTISFEAIEGGDMEDVEAVGNLRAATAVFRHTHDGWMTEGRAIMNLEPNEAIEHFRERLDAIAD